MRCFSGQVRAVRVDAETRKEAGQPAIPGSSGWQEALELLDEEVFVAQLHRRAKFLNEDFQSHILRILQQRGQVAVSLPNDEIGFSCARALPGH